jgi:carboxypeptidase C (cathepsin A)
MKRTFPALLASLFAGVLFFANALAEEANPPPQAHQPQSPAQDASRLLPADSVTHHTIGTGTQQLKYTATAGTLPLLGPKNETAAKIFYVAYTLDGAAKRPITFVFNGGPGAASAFLHLGALGPRVVKFVDNGSSAAQPVQLSDNPDSWLAFTDLVFVDPVGTGYSRATADGDEAARAYWGVEKDADSLADFIRLYLARNNKEIAPVFLVGESYGGFRANLLLNRLLRSGVQAKGAVLISPALEFSMLQSDNFSPLPLALALPSIAAANIELREGANAPLDAVRDAENFARTTYLLDLVDGLKQDDTLVTALSRYTGLDPAVIARHHGRISASLFLREYRKTNDRALSRYDATVSVPLPRPADDKHFDPILEGAASVLRPAMVQYAGEELGFRTDLPYRLLNREVSRKWDFGTKPNDQGYAGSLDELQQARTVNPKLKILIAHGYTDLVTPFSISRYLISQLEPIETAAPVAIKLYRGGHMMYLRPASRHQLSGDVGELFRSASITE